MCSTVFCLSKWDVVNHCATKVGLIGRDTVCDGMEVPTEVQPIRNVSVTHDDCLADDDMVWVYRMMQ